MFVIYYSMIIYNKCIILYRSHIHICNICTLWEYGRLDVTRKPMTDDMGNVHIKYNTYWTVMSCTIVFRLNISIIINYI